MRFAFFRPNDLDEAVRVGTASRVVWEKNAKVAVYVDSTGKAKPGTLVPGFKAPTGFHHASHCDQQLLFVIL
jgi:hypothetical protein